MKLEQALERYERIKKERERELEKIRKKYNKRLKKDLKEILKKLDELERKEIPKNIDERIKRILEGERKSYVSSLRTALKSIENMEDLGKRLPDLSKFHVGHGKYLIEVFDREIYTINKLLKGISEDYASYYREISEKMLEEIDVHSLLREMREVRDALERAREERDKLRRLSDEKHTKLTKLQEEKGLPQLEEEIKELASEIRKIEIEIRSKASKLQKPLKRMRLGGFASEFAKDSGLAIEEPQRTLELLKNVEPKLEDKYRKPARWLLENLPEKVSEITEKRARLEELGEKKARILEESTSMEKEIWEIERLIEEKEEEIRRLKRRLEHLEKEFEEGLRKIEDVLGERIER